jgi:CelD/BcsL family acetyltransferase involved in cellulose biosynthesis
MHVDVIPIKNLSEDMKQKWLELQASNPNLAGPLFHPELFVSIAKFYPNIYVSVIYNDGRDITGFLPFRKRPNTFVAKPIFLCEYQAVIGAPGQGWDIGRILKKSGLMGWEVHSLADFGNIEGEAERAEIFDSPRVDLTGGFEKYYATLRQRKIGFRDLMYRKRLLDKKVGATRLVHSCKDINVLHKLLDWKVGRFQDDLCWDPEITRAIMEHLFHLDGSSLTGILSALYAGDELLAATFGLKYQGILEGIIMAFNPIFVESGPGLLLTYCMISELHAFQCNMLGLGGKDDSYKRGFANSGLPVISGYLGTNTLKDMIKSVNWLYQGLKPVIKMKRIVMDSLLR